MKIYLSTFFAFVICLVANAQQDPQYTQYMYNMSTVNPAYVKDQPGLISAGLLYRQQWLGIEGAPQTGNAFVNFPTNNKVELSLNYVNDRIGDAIPVTNNFANFDFAYISQISSSLKLSYGLKAGVNHFSINALNSDVASDIAFSEKVSEYTMTFGVGLFLFGDQFYAGVSAPNVLPKEVKIKEVSVSKKTTQLYGIAGYIFELSTSSKLKPSVVLQQVFGSPLSFSTSLNYLYNNKFEIGASYRYQDAVSAIVGFQITKNLKLGYAYDYTLSDFSGNATGSHEALVIFDFDLLSLGKKYVSPRFY